MPKSQRKNARRVTPTPYDFSRQDTILMRAVFSRLRCVNHNIYQAATRSRHRSCIEKAWPQQWKKHMRILVLDDDPIQLELAGAALESCGYENVRKSSDVQGYLAQIERREEEFNLVLLDVLMPEVDGIEACRRIRQSVVGVDTSIIMMTARSDRNCIDQAFSAGADDYIIKPFDSLELSNRIAGVLQRKAPTNKADRRSTLYQGETFDLSDCPGLISSGAMEAYLSALDKGRASLSMATAFQADEWSSATSDLSKDARKALICDLARIIQDELSQTSHVLAYFGDGAFVCITKRADPAISAGFARRVRNASLVLNCPLTMHRYMQDGQPAGRDPLDLVRGALHAPNVPTNFSQKNHGALSFPDLFSL